MIEYLKYGREQIPFLLPRDAEILRINEPDIAINKTVFTDRLQKQLRLLNPDLSRTAVVVADKTRLCGYPQYLPILLRSLQDYGAKPDNITIYIAYGTHSRQTQEESLLTYGQSYSKYRFIHHNCQDKKLFADLGQTGSGTNVFIRKDILESTFVITFGAVSHHYFAGFGGGRKLIFPGLGFKESIYQYHSLFLDKKNKRLSVFCKSGIIKDNPIARDIAEFEKFKPADMSVHGILNSKGQVCDILVGTGTKHFENACTPHSKNCAVKTESKYDLVIGSCGGHPKDINFIQAHKSIENAAGFVRDNGMLIIFVKCPDSIGSETFLPWFELKDKNKAFHRLSENYQGNGGTALCMTEKTERINIFLVTELPYSITKLIGVKKISAEHAQNIANSFKGSTAVYLSGSIFYMNHYTKRNKNFSSKNPQKHA